MPRFFFHVRRGGVVATDEEGAEYADVHSALEEAVEGARELVAAWVKLGDPIAPGAVVVTDEAGTVVGEVPFHDVLRGPPRT